jgi:hypothetical protein
MPSGSKIVCLDGISFLGCEENEVLLSRMATLHVKNIQNRTNEDGYTIVTVD